MRILTSIVVDKGLKTCMPAAENSKQIMWTLELYTCIWNVTSSKQNLWHAEYLAHHLEKMGLVLGFISLEILGLLQGFARLIDEPVV